MIENQRSHSNIYCRVFVKTPMLRCGFKNQRFPVSHVCSNHERLTFCRLNNMLGGHHVAETTARGAARNGHDESRSPVDNAVIQVTETNEEHALSDRLRDSHIYLCRGRA